MVGDSLNLVDLVSRNLTGDFSKKISTLLGEDRSKTDAGISAAVPGILGGLDHLASTPDGARRLSSAVDDADDGIMSKIGGVLGTDAFSETGSGMLGSLLGATGLSDLSSNVGRSSGLSGKSVTTLLGFIAPVVLGVLKSVKRSKGLDSLGLSNLLANQRGNIAAAMPEGMPGSRIRTATEPRAYTTEETHARPEAHATMASAEPKRSSLSWILPLLLLAGLIGLIWHWASRPPVHAGRDDNRVVERDKAKDTTGYGTTASFATLKAKYQSVIDRAQEQGVKITNLQQQDGKLVLKGTAPSLEAANRVRDEIKRINPKMDDVVADITVSPSESASTTTPREDTPVTLPREKPTAPTGAVTGSETQTYVVKPGDTLYKISKHFYGNGMDYKRIVDANTGILKSQNTVHVGQELTIPMK